MVETHAADYGFALSHPRHAEAVTGYVYAPWHFRYLGNSCAEAWAPSGLTLVEFLSAGETASARQDARMLG